MLRTALLLVVFAPGALAQPDFLRGPETETESEPSIVEHSMTGRFVVVEGLPESAAFDRLIVDAKTKERAAQLARDRIDRLAFSLVDHIDTVKQITDEMTAGRGGEAQKLLAELREEFEPGSPRSPLLGDLSDLLEPPQRGQFHAAVDEYWEAWMTARIREADSDPDDAEIRAEAQRRLSFELFQQDVRVAYDISLKQYRDSMQGIYDAVDPTPEQRVRIREHVIAYIKRTRLDPTPAQRIEATLDIYRLLDDERQEKLFEYVTRVLLSRG